MREIRKEGTKGLSMPAVAAGEYTVHLVVDGAEQRGALTVHDDPKRRMSTAEREEWTAIQILLWQTAVGAEGAHERAVALAEQARRQPGERLQATAARLKAIQEPLEEIGEHAEAMLRRIVKAARPLPKGDVNTARGYAAELDRRRAELASLQAGMRREPQ
jgi:hypothetical protein